MDHASGTDDVYALRPLLFSIAYRMLGSVTDAEDVVQEAFLRWQRVDTDEVDSPKAYLSSVVTRLCIDQLRSARSQRETYVGPWLPEPLVTDPDGDASVTVERADSLSMAFLVLLEKLSPMQRAVFLLKDVFGYSFAEIASFVGHTEENSRQLASRARKHLASERPRFEADKARGQELTMSFMEACSTGDLDRLMSLFSQDIVLYSDGGGKARAARVPIFGPAKVARFTAAIVQKAIEDQIAVRVAEVNGQPGIVVYDAAGTPTTVVAFDVLDGVIQTVRLVVNPDKLRSVR